MNDYPIVVTDVYCYTVIESRKSELIEDNKIVV
jgi:hypothetical protein